MHPSEQRAIFLMLDSVEQQIRNIKSLLGHIPQTAGPLPVPGIPRASTYLDDKDEDDLDKKMEEVRLAMLQEDERAVQSAYQTEGLNG